MSKPSATLTPEEVAGLLRMSTSTVRRQINSGKFAFPARKTGNTYLIPSRPIYDFLGLEPEHLPAA